jgi:GT2 family glycosyltransferase
VPVTPPLADAIVLGYGRFEDLTRHCLDSLMPDAADCGVRVTAVDNGSPDDSAQRMRDYAAARPSLRALFNAENLGFAGGMNDAAGRCDAPWLLLVNSDTRFAVGALRALVRVLSEAPDDVAVVGPVTNAAGNAQHLDLPGGTPEQVLAGAAALIDQPTGELIPIYRADFFCVAVRRAAWEALGGLDLAYGRGYYEDFDFSLRAVESGWRVMLCEDAFVHHQGGSSFAGSAAQKAEVKALIARNKQLFLQRHPRARLPHRREDNLEVLRRYAELPEQRRTAPGLRLRTKLRAGLAARDLPRSPLKRWLWRRKVNAVLARLPR